MVAKTPQYNTVYFPIFSAISMSFNAYSHLFNVLEPVSIAALIVLKLLSNV